MTAATLSRLPLSAGGALAGSVARGGLWIVAAAIDGGYWLLKQFLRAPVAVSCVAAVAGFSLLAGGNALFMQTERHPAPLFFSPSVHAAPHTSPRAHPAVPAPRPLARPIELDDETTGSVGAEPAAPHAIGNDDVLMLQRKLVALDLLSDKPDGIFGRRTATAIKVFQQKAGMRPDGRLTHELLDAVLAAPMPKPELIPAAAVQAPQAAAPIAALAPPAKPVTTETPVVRTLPPAPIVATGKPVPLAPLPQIARPQATPAAPAVEKVALAPVQPAAAPAAAAPLAPPTATAPATANQPDSAPSDNDTGRASAMAMNSPPAAPAVTAPAVPVSPDASPAQKLAAQMGTLPPEATAATAVPGEQTASADTSSDVSSDPGDGAGSTDPALITKIQRGLASLGFLGAKIDGVPGEGTAKAIRNFEVFYDYRVTGLATPQLLDLLIQHGATI